MPPTLRMIRFSPSMASRLSCVFFVVGFAFVESIHQSAVDGFLVPSGDFVALFELTGRRRRLHCFSQTRSSLTRFFEFSHASTWKYSRSLPPGTFPPYLFVLFFCYACFLNVVRNYYNFNFLNARRSSLRSETN